MSIYVFIKKMKLIEAHGITRITTVVPLVLYTAFNVIAIGDQFCNS